MEVLRDIGARLDQVTESAQTEELSPAIRAELDSLRAEIRSVTPPPTRSRLTQQPLIIGRTDAWISDLFKTQATHSFQGLDAVKLSLQIGSSEMARYGCTVKAPTGATYSAIARQLFSSALVAKTYSIVYPDEFKESEPLRAGHYEVEWATGASARPNGRNERAYGVARSGGNSSRRNRLVHDPRKSGKLKRRQRRLSH